MSSDPAVPNRTFDDDTHTSCVTFVRVYFLFLSFSFVSLAEGSGVTAPSLLPSFSALLLLVPLVAAAVGVLLWRQRHISQRGESSGAFIC